MMFRILLKDGGNISIDIEKWEHDSEDNVILLQGKNAGILNFNNITGIVYDGESQDTRSYDTWNAMRSRCDNSWTTGMCTTHNHECCFEKCPLLK